MYHCARGTVKNWKMQQFKEVKSQNLEINFCSGGGQHKHPIPCWLGSFFFPKMLSVALIRGYTLFHGDDITETKCLLWTQVLKTLLYRVCVSNRLDYTPMLLKRWNATEKRNVVDWRSGSIYIFVWRKDGISLLWRSDNFIVLNFLEGKTNVFLPQQRRFCVYYMCAHTAAAACKYSFGYIEP